MGEVLQILDALGLDRLLGHGHNGQRRILQIRRPPLGGHDEVVPRLTAIYSTIAKLLENPEEKLYLHNEEFGDRVIGVIAGYLLYAGLVEQGPHAISVVEKLTGRSLDAEGREIVAVTLAEIKK